MRIPRVNEIHMCKLFDFFSFHCFVRHFMIPQEIESRFFSYIGKTFTTTYKEHRLNSADLIMIFLFSQSKRRGRISYEKISFHEMSSYFLH